MKKHTFQISIRLATIAAFVLLIASFKSATRIKITRSAGEKKTTKVVADKDAEIIRKRIVDDLLEPSVNTEKIKKLVQTIQPDGSWPGINYKDTTKTGFQHSIH
ncbi:MAG: hypothetical protein ACR2KZ_18100, partial [Segetibacter sp.]